MQKIRTFLWFDDQAEEAAKYYVSIFRNSKITGITHYGEHGAEASGRPQGSVMTVSFMLEGQEFVALNGGPAFTFNPAISLAVSCATQQEIDTLWKKLSADGAEVECGWLTDKYGLSWQIVPNTLDKLLSDADPVRAERVMEAVLTMKKLDIATLQHAYNGTRTVRSRTQEERITSKVL